jgi:hypothetical protein
LLAREVHLKEPVFDIGELDLQSIDALLQL